MQGLDRESRKSRRPAFPAVRATTRRPAPFSLLPARRTRPNPADRESTRAAYLGTRALHRISANERLLRALRVERPVHAERGRQAKTTGTAAPAASTATTAGRRPRRVGRFAALRRRRGATPRPASSANAGRPGSTYVMRMLPRRREEQHRRHGPQREVDAPRIGRERAKRVASPQPPSRDRDERADRPGERRGDPEEPDPSAWMRHARRRTDRRSSPARQSASNARR